MAVGSAVLSAVGAIEVLFGVLPCVMWLWLVGGGCAVDTLWQADWGGLRAGACFWRWGAWGWDSGLVAWWPVVRLGVCAVLRPFRLVRLWGGAQRAAGSFGVLGVFVLVLSRARGVGASLASEGFCACGGARGALAGVGGLLLCVLGFAGCALAWPCEQG